VSTRVLAGLLALAAAAACKQNPVKAVEPELAVSSLEAPFGPVKLGTAGTVTLELRALTQSAVDLTEIAIDGDAAFSVDAPPAQVPGLDVRTLSIVFRPLEVRAHAATLRVRSNDARHPEYLIALSGDGSTAQLTLVPGCDAAAGCTGSVVLAPPALDFGEEPLLRRLPLEDAKLPYLELRSSGAVPLTVTSVAIEGADATAFTLVGAPTFPADIAAGASTTVRLRFVPTLQSQLSYAATAVLTTDDPLAAEVRVPLTGRARPNLPPELCLNLVEVAPPGGAPVQSYDAAADWLLAPPAGGYDFTLTRPIPPRAVITFSAHSPGSARACTTDPEDGRLLLSYAWSLVSSPSGAPPALAGETGPTLKLVPVATGEYVVRLEVQDAQGNAAQATARFRVEVRNDLVVQLD